MPLRVWWSFPWQSLSGIIRQDFTCRILKNTYVKLSKKASSITCPAKVNPSTWMKPTPMPTLIGSLAYRMLKESGYYTAVD